MKAILAIKLAKDKGQFRWYLQMVDTSHCTRSPLLFFPLSLCLCSFPSQLFYFCPTFQFLLMTIKYVG
jgi:hypothetical protein